MDGKVTLKDISKATGYSLISIHRAIYNKEGLSEETRKKILKAVEKTGYRVNYMASALKRKTIKIALIMCEGNTTGDYHNTMLAGCRMAAGEFAGLNCTVSEFLYPAGLIGAKQECRILDSLLYEHPEEYDGLLVVPENTGRELSLCLNKHIAQGTPVILIDNKFEDMKYLCCISPRSYLIGRLGAEYLCKTSSPGKILVALGDETSKTHQENVEGFEAYINDNKLPFSCVYIHDPYDEEEETALIDSAVQSDPAITAMYTVREKNSHALAKVASRYPQRKFQVLASDLCPSNVQNLKEGIVSGVIDKNAYQRGYLGMSTLFGYVLKHENPKAKILSVPVSIVMQSNLPFYVGEMGSGICISSTEI
ncbi:LacI family DNA-binding transcriptional regulator [Treponema parvum]|uniref:LacI family DNA-binding transcriptional regulator n=1 Tax=Treponema parvum TaxID=138851 RepID=A0A975EYY4_9SPIR|nr:LacI family DNA-binding transcriptional regulator [Treponema parvum]QTQ11342.1 LacI family DNA-binding transcriptional regulator [Treponema parvum]